MKNLKDILSTACAIVIALCGAGGVLWTLGIEYPNWVKVVAGILATIALYVSMQLIGKNADGSTKSPEQLQIQQDPKKDIGSGM